jgi:hypothetical protein
VTESQPRTIDALQVSASAPVVTVIERFAPPDPARLASPAEDLTTVTYPPSTEARPPDGRPEVAAARTYLEGVLSKAGGFTGAVLLAGQRGEVVLYSQWATAGNPPAEMAAEWSLAPALPDLDRVDGRTYRVDFSAPRPVSEISLPKTPRAHFGVFTVAPENQERLLVLASEYAPKSMGTPGLLAVNFHGSLDGHRVINLGLWSDFEGFGELEKRPGFVDAGNYWDGVAGFRPQYFDVVAVVTHD